MLNGCSDLSPTEFADIVQIDEDVFDERITIDIATKLNPLEFEALVASLWNKQGFRTVRVVNISRLLCEIFDRPNPAPGAEGRWR